ncbi:uncharacterized protein LOC105935689 isoform X2 [Fundulus heteroclitus]|uniref:uncharacterized protein LOC118556813 isoform X2 n=1 Tax=Fundulus heteroclitus TaxID=8078 RepID=UPI00165A1E58|nr:uncharacterized protein LOC118556813 isoform X2 [Fundulus heteroclitus]XP_035992314.1 uncharacterized protein LOC118562981 isoform X2 [Fundulus heteroclitus]XP_036000511.1 uncharacterized protein LOC105935689 isoform X2 [Fundulus heteroclitus]
MTAEKLSRIFQVTAHSLYMTDDANVAVFPGASGAFSTLDLSPRGHYEVHGEEDTSCASPSTQRFTFMRTSATTPGPALERAALAPPPPPRATASKTFQRSIFLAEVVGGRLSPSRMVVVRFLECEATLQGIIGKVQDAIGSHDPIVLTDAQGNAILESEGTTGSQYWKQNARKILAVQEQSFQVLQGNKRRRMSSRKDEEAAGIGEVTEKIEELLLASQNLPDVTASIRELTNLAATQKVILTPSQLHTIKQGFCCVICMKFIEEPVFTQCCQSIIGCKTCVEQWQETSVHCAKCRVNTAGNNILEVNGLSEAFSVLSSLFQEE